MREELVASAIWKQEGPVREAACTTRIDVFTDRSRLLHRQAGCDFVWYRAVATRIRQIEAESILPIMQAHTCSALCLSVGSSANRISVMVASYHGAMAGCPRAGNKSANYASQRSGLTRCAESGMGCLEGRQPGQLLLCAGECPRLAATVATSFAPSFPGSELWKSWLSEHGLGICRQDRPGGTLVHRTRCFRIALATAASVSIARPTTSSNPVTGPSLWPDRAGGRSWIIFRGHA